MRPVKVLKFGGSCFPKPQSYGEVANFLKDKVEAGERLCVVVSAMSGTTGRLSELLHEVVDQPDCEDLDAVLSTGEVLAAALLRAAISKVGLKAVAVNGYSLGWIVTEDFTRAELLDHADDVLTRHFETADIVVVAGGQALTTDGRIAMLGRNSSDLTAVVCAACLQAPVCTIYSDVDGIYTADPYKISEAQLIPKLDYAAAETYSKAGAKVLHHVCVAFARKHSITIECAQFDADTGLETTGTEVGPHGDGVQLILLPRYTRIRHQREATANVLSMVLSRNGLQNYVLSSEPNCVAVSDATYDQEVIELADNAEITRNLTLVIAYEKTDIAFSALASKDEALVLAKQHHEALIKQGRFLKASNAHVKMRGSHSGVFGSVGTELGM